MKRVKLMVMARKMGYKVKKTTYWNVWKEYRSRRIIVKTNNNSNRKLAGRIIR